MSNDWSNPTDFDTVCRRNAGRRRYISQYVDNFPLPDPESPESLKVIRLVKTLIECEPQVQRSDLESEVDYLVWRAFGLEQPAR